MPDKKELLGKLDSAAMERVARHYRDGAFEFSLNAEGHTVHEGNTVYHIVPRFAEPGTESVLQKLCRPHGTGTERNRMKRAAIKRSKPYN